MEIINPGVITIGGRKRKFDIELPAPASVWILGSAPGSNDPQGVAYGAGLFVAISDDINTSANRVYTSETGATWIPRVNTTISSFGLVWSGSLFVSIATNKVGDANVMTSPDGIVWTIRDTPSEPTVSFRAVTFGNGIFVAVAFTDFGSDSTMSSPDGITWTMHPDDGNFAEYQAVTFGNGLFVAVGQNAAVMSSPDAVTWTARTAAIAGNIRGVAYGNGVFVAVSTGGGVMSSTNGINWTARTATASTWNAIAFGNGRFVAVSGNTTNVITSTDGITWINYQMSSNIDCTAITYGIGRWVAVGNVLPKYAYASG